jgi:hypothetical protein
VIEPGYFPVKIHAALLPEDRSVVIRDSWDIAIDVAAARLARGFCARRVPVAAALQRLNTSP